MYIARTFLCGALLGLAVQAGADDTPYKHDYINGGNFDGAPEAAQAPSSEPAVVPRGTETAYPRHRNDASFGRHSAVPGETGPLKSARTRE